MEEGREVGNKEGREEGREVRRKEGHEIAMLDSVRHLMDHMSWTAEQSMKALGLSVNEQKEMLMKL